MGEDGQKPKEPVYLRRKTNGDLGQKKKSAESRGEKPSFNQRFFLARSTEKDITVETD